MKRVRRMSQWVYKKPLSTCQAQQADSKLKQNFLKRALEQPKTEIVERQRIEQETDLFFALSSDILGIVGFDGYFKRLNPAVERLLGFSQSEFLAKPFLEFVHPQDQAATVAIVQKLTTGERIDNFQNRYRCKDGSYKWLSWSGIAVVEEALIYCIAHDITEQRQAELELQDSEERYRLLANNFPNGAVLLFDRELRYILADGIGLAEIGLSKELLEGKTIWEVFPPEISGSIEPHYRAALDGQVTVVEVPYADRIYQVHYMPVQNGLEELAAGLVMTQDITAQKQTEAALKYQREQEQLIVGITQRVRQSLELEDILNTTVAEVREFFKSDRVIIYHLEPLMGGTVIAESVGEEWPPLSGSVINDCQFNQDYAQLYQQGRVQAVEDIYTAGLTQCHVDLLAQFQVRANLAVPIVQEDKLWGLLVVQQCRGARHWQDLEISLLKQLALQVAITIQQAELHQQVQQLNTNLEAEVQARTTELQQALDFESLLKRITDKVRDSLDEAQILQVAVQALALGLQVYSCDAGLYNLEKGTSTICYEYVRCEMPSAMGKIVPLSSRFDVYIHLLQGRALQFSWMPKHTNPVRPVQKRLTTLACPLIDDQGVIGDLWLYKGGEECFTESEIRLVQQVANQCAIAVRQARLYQASQAQVVELERLNQLKDDFLCTVSHELRTPMSNIKVAIQMLELMLPIDLLNPEQDRTTRYFNILQSECQREITLINDLLDLTRLDAGTEPLNLTIIDPQIWIPHVLEPFEERIRNQQQHLQVDIPAILPPLMTDLSYLERILTELLNNACKYTPIGEVIRVTAQTTSVGIQICVYNSGVEIPASELERIFDKFYRIPNNDPWKHGGTGLGLALVRRLVEQINGTITASSSQGQIRFALQLPLLPPTDKSSYNHL